MLAFREELDVVKFLCKDLWGAVFQKQMDSLRTNHQVSARPAPGFLAVRAEGKRRLLKGTLCQEAGAGLTPGQPHLLAEAAVGLRAPPG